MATRVAQLRDNDAPDYPAAMRDVARNCIHGVDRNPMAVELAKVALWIETVEPGKPLGFLDANIHCGDSLLGVFDLKALEKGIPDDAYKPLTGDDKETAKWFARRNKAEKTDRAVSTGRAAAAAFRRRNSPPIWTICGTCRKTRSSRWRQSESGSRPGRTTRSAGPPRSRAIFTPPRSCCPREAAFPPTPTV